MKKILLAFIVLLLAVQLLNAQTLPWSQRMAATAMNIWKDTANVKWADEQGLLWHGIEQVWLQTANKKYFQYLQQRVDQGIMAEGCIRSCDTEDYDLDNLLSGHAVLSLYQVLRTPKYYKVAKLLREQLSKQPRTPGGGFWHDKRYNNQMWLADLYKSEPFYAEYAKVFQEDTAFNDIAKQFILVERMTRDPKTGLLRHTWDASKNEQWANSKTSQSPNFLGKPMGWFGMALVDVLDEIPTNHPKRAELLVILNRFATAVAKYQDKQSGLWYRVLNKGEKGNYLEASASGMFVYALAKGVRQHNLPNYFRGVAQNGYKGIINKYITTDTNGQVNLTDSSGITGLSGNPYNNSSYSPEKNILTNDAIGVGAFIQASVEMERMATLPFGRDKTVLLDSYFNNEQVKDITGNRVPYHYKWDERDNNGISLLGQVFNNYGLNLATLYEAPTKAKLKPASVYIIVDPDTPKENSNTNYIEPAHVKAISNWVKKGGALVVMGNDTGNAEFKHMNTLLSRFGIQFKKYIINHTVGNPFEQGAVSIPAGNEIIKSAQKIFIENISTFTIVSPAKSMLNHKGEIVIAISRYGKGIVLAVGDTWFYNKYMDGRNLPPRFENFKAANDFVSWLIQQIPGAATNDFK